MSRLKKKTDKTYTATEIAQLFGIHLITVQRYIKKLNLDVKKAGNEWQFNQKHIDAIKNYRLELFKRYYGDVLEMNYT